MSDATFTFRVDDGLKAEFANAAKANDRTGAQLLRDFMRSYVAQQEEVQQYDAWLAKKVEQSRASAEAGNLIPASDRKSTRLNFSHVAISYAVFCLKQKKE